VREGWRGLVEGKFQPLDDRAISGILPRGGTILGTTRTNPYKVEGGVERVLEHFAGERLDALVAIGGEDTLGVASHLFEERGFPVVGVPKTIDNDLSATDYTFGFDTALTVATEAIDRLHTTAESHNRVMVVEVMGRHTGWIAVLSGIAGGADVILIPEIPFTVEAVASTVTTREFRGSNFSIVICAEGAAERDGGGQTYQEATGTLGGVGAYVATQVGKVTGKDARVVVLGHLQRGGMPTPFDRILATRFGAAAVRVLAEGRYGEVVVSRGMEIGTVLMPECAGKVRTVPPDHEMIRTCRGLGIGFGDEEDESLIPEPLA